MHEFQDRCIKYFAEFTILSSQMDYNSGGFLNFYSHPSLELYLPLYISFTLTNSRAVTYHNLSTTSELVFKWNVMCSTKVYPTLRVNMTSLCILCLAGSKHVCCMPFWNMCHPETCFRLAWWALLKNMYFWNMFQIGTVKTLSCRSRMLNGRLWSTNYCTKRPKVSPSCICLFIFQ